ncbi:MAG: 4-alpha-glucanotransferase [Streptosporangiales bacterium]|nr:4-alpha-glucanotransferase [Streptosporangiales bacterium]
MSDRGEWEPLRELAEAYGIATSYRDWQGNPVEVPRSTVVGVLAALGVDVPTPERIEQALAQRRLAPWRRVLPPVVVTTEGTAPSVRVHVPEATPVDVEVRCEDGTVRRDLMQLLVHVQPVEVDGVLVGEYVYRLPADLPLGWHTVVARHTGGEATAPVAVTPAFLGVPAGLRTWGLMVQLYSVRSAASWGIGDLHDLADLTGWSAGAGAGLVLVNPLHASAPVPPLEPSPYFPATRRFPNPLYLRVEDIAEYATAPVEVRARVDDLAQPLRPSPATADRLDRDSCWRAKLAALEMVYELPRSRSRQQEYERFVAAEGSALDEFATWCALAEKHGADWRGWPTGLRAPGAPDVAAARADLADRVDFYCWLQWQLDEQLAAVQRTATAAGMPLGVMHDLAVGVAPGGVDAWAGQDVLALGVTAGAPPDAFNQQGQDWQQPPWHPTRLAEAGYAPYRDMLRALLRHSGGLRVDHVAGLFRLWWIPDGASPFDGTYVRYDHQAMVGILALEAHRAGAVVVGEDLGTIEPATRDYLAERGVLGTSVLWFERDDGGAPLPAERWRELCLATVTTHDLPPTAGYLAGDHVALRHELGLLTRSVEDERAADEADRAQWLETLRTNGLLDDPAAGDAHVIAAMHAYVCRTPARLVGVALTDAVGERRTQNQPGTVDEYPNWRVPLTDPDGRPLLLEDVMSSPRALDLLRVVHRALRS